MPTNQPHLDPARRPKAAARTTPVEMRSVALIPSARPATVERMSSSLLLGSFQGAIDMEIAKRFSSP